MQPLITWRHRITAVFAAAALILTAGTASGQAKAGSWRTGADLAVFAGAGSSGTTTDPAIGASIGWEVMPRLAVEGTGIWVDGSAVNTFAALAGARVTLTAQQRVVPFVFAAAGVENTSIEANRNGIAPFYQRRLTATAGFPQTTTTFDDFAFSVGGGVDWFVNRHAALRPDVRVLLAHAAGETHAVAVYGIHLAYYFEPHGSAPARAFARHW